MHNQCSKSVLASFGWLSQSTGLSLQACIIPF